MPPSTMTCRKCEIVSHNPTDATYGWCSNCQLFQYEIYNPRPRNGEDHTAPPVRLDTIVGDIQRSKRAYMGQGSRVSLLFEQFTAKNGTLAWRACVMINGKTAEYSRREQLSPQDALRELDLLCGGTNAEDV